MPVDNQFHHQRYDIAPPPERHRFISVAHLPEPDSSEYQDQLRAGGRLMRSAGIRTIYLVHGSLTGSDASGITRELKRLRPDLAFALGKSRKQLVDMLAGDMANYTDEYASQFEQGINEPGQAAIWVKRFIWSSENHHTGRAIGALRLLIELASQSPRVQGRVMLWGHSHAGNVFAILTNLLGSDHALRLRFLDCFGDWLQRREPAVWEAGRAILQDPPAELLTSPPDIITFGTPIRYGWELRGCGELLHFVNHHPLTSPPERAPFPPTADQLRHLSAGDYFQQFFIAGTNFPPAFWAWGLWQVERRLKRLLQDQLSSRSLIKSLRHGRRVAADGRTLLVDYAASDSHAKTLAGHAVYTRLHWLPFHVMQVCQHALQPDA